MMTPTETEVFAQLERLAACCPWEETNIWIIRKPAGHIGFTAYAGGNQDVGLVGSVFGHGLTPAEAVDSLLRSSPDRNVNQEDMKREQIAKLRLEIARLESTMFELPPYRPLPLIGVASSPEPIVTRDLPINI